MENGVICFAASNLRRINQISISLNDQVLIMIAPFFRCPIATREKNAQKTKEKKTIKRISLNAALFIRLCVCICCWRKPTDPFQNTTTTNRSQRARDACYTFRNLVPMPFVYLLYIVALCTREYFNLHAVQHNRLGFNFFSSSSSSVSSEAPVPVYNSSNVLRRTAHGS